MHGKVEMMSQMYNELDKLHGKKAQLDKVTSKESYRSPRVKKYTELAVTTSPSSVKQRLKFRTELSMRNMRNKNDMRMKSARNMTLMKSRNMTEENPDTHKSTVIPDMTKPQDLRDNPDLNPVLGTRFDNKMIMMTNGSLSQPRITAFLNKK